jgi:hypothetical protein
MSAELDLNPLLSQMPAPEDGTVVVLVVRVTERIQLVIAVLAAVARVIFAHR